MSHLTWQQLSPFYYDNHNALFNVTAITSLLFSQPYCPIQHNSN